MAKKKATKKRTARTAGKRAKARNPKRGREPKSTRRRDPRIWIKPLKTLACRDGLYVKGVPCEIRLSTLGKLGDRLPHLRIPNPYTSRPQPPIEEIHDGDDDSTETQTAADTESGEGPADEDGQTVPPGEESAVEAEVKPD